MTHPTFEHVALFQMLDRVEALERMVETLSTSNAALYRRLDHLETEARRARRGRGQEKAG